MSKIVMEELAHACSYRIMHQLSVGLHVVSMMIAVAGKPRSYMHPRK